jgi:hypothetical protein
MPAVNFGRMYQAVVLDAKAGDGSSKIVYWSRPFNWKNQILNGKRKLGKISQFIAYSVI